jgi:hypothetical protein
VSRGRKWALAGAVVTAIGGCKAAGSFLQEVFKERPPMALESLELASDARVDSTGHLKGTFVGEGTPREVHLLSSDTALMVTLLRRYSAEKVPPGDLGAWLGRRRIVALDLNRGGAVRGLVGSPEGHTVVRLRAALVRGGVCGWRSAQAELIVDDGNYGGPSLAGPVFGSFRGTDPGNHEVGYRRDPPAPGNELLDTLLARTAGVMDSVLDARLGSRDRPLAAVGGPPEINTLEDIDAADVIPFRVYSDRVRYAVALRSRRLTQRGDTVLAATLMVWDSAGTWRQFVFRPTLLQLHRGLLIPRTGWPPYFWRRLAALDAFSSDRDDLWMEQVDVSSGTVRWGVVEPEYNVIVASTDVGGPCLQ